MAEEEFKKGRGAQINTPNRFDELRFDPSTFDEVNQDQEYGASAPKTVYLETHAKTLVNPVPSPDIGMNWSMNPYQGCEHGCIYCYARNSHQYWGYSAGLDFETRILVKKNAPELLRAKLRSRSWKAEAIMLSGNTDCYQPIERKLGITRKLLEVLWDFRHPVGIITKNSLILRDTDILQEMAKHNLVKVSLSINGLDEKTRQYLEPRTASFKKRLEVIRKLTDAGIPVNAMIAPVIPGLNDHEIFDTVKAAADAGALSAHHIVVRLNGEVRALFEDWLAHTFPDRAAKIIRKIADMHGGQTNDSRFGVRMKGEGNYASIIYEQMKLARARFMADRQMPKFNTELYPLYRDRQYSLF